MGQTMKSIITSVLLLSLTGCATMDYDTEYQLRRAVIKALPR